MNFEDKIKELKIVLPEAKAPVGSYVATKISGKSIAYSHRYEGMNIYEKKSKIDYPFIQTLPGYPTKITWHRVPEYPFQLY